jgi:hypothetical protein
VIDNRICDGHIHDNPIYKGPYFFVSFQELSCNFIDIFQAIAQSFSTGRIVVKTMAFGSGADASKLRQLATLGGGEFSAAVRLISAELFP